ncbi:hypothetical protein OSB04_005167 [Centaurea solstitialis]|uniref:Uncharacterized protein n=1 Tax=Centaurea solstitialis TaxID=347529 RepID=A0AA38TYJ3_9ASTR|nr:hypothetical protein OSB04_005167 [Centaurea solstitialis]
MAATQLIRTWRPSSAVNSAPSTSQTTFTTTSLKVKCMSKAAGFNIENNRLAGDGERKPVVIAKAAACSEAVPANVAVDEPRQTTEGLDLATLMAMVRPAVVRRLLPVTRSRSWRSIVQLFVEKAIIDCRFFTLFAIAGTLLGSVLCFLEGTFLVMESYFQYFQSDHGHIMQLLIESLDMFLVGNCDACIWDGIACDGSKSQLPSSNFFGIYHLKEHLSSVGIKSVIQAKSMIGYALMLLLQVGVLEKFKSIPLVSGLDLACFAGAVFVSSAGLFILSKLSLDS